MLDENRILEKRAEEARTTIANRESELEKLFLAQEKQERMWEEKQKKEERLRKEAEKRSNDMKLVVDRLTMVHGDGQDLSPAASLAMGQKKDGKSYTQFYLDYAIQENKLRQAEEEVIRLTSLLDEISADISEKVSAAGRFPRLLTDSRNHCWTSKPPNTPLRLTAPTHSPRSSPLR